MLADIKDNSVMLKVKADVTGVQIVVDSLKAKTCIFCSGWGHISSDYSKRSGDKQRGCPTAEYFKDLAIASLINRDKYTELLGKKVLEER